MRVKVWLSWAASQYRPFLSVQSETGTWSSGPGAALTAEHFDVPGADGTRSRPSTRKHRRGCVLSLGSIAADQAIPCVI